MDSTEIPADLRAWAYTHQPTLVALRDALGLRDRVSVTPLMHDGTLAWRIADDTDADYSPSVLDAAHALVDYWGLEGPLDAEWEVVAARTSLGLGQAALEGSR